MDGGKKHQECSGGPGDQLLNLEAAGLVRQGLKSAH